MNRIFLAFAAVALASSPAAAEPRAHADFESVRASGRFEVEVQVGPGFSVDVGGPDAAGITTRIHGDTLVVEPARRSWFGERSYNAHVRITLPRLRGVAAARGATMRAQAGGECDAFSAAAAMGSQLQVSGLECESVEASAAMGAELRLEGSCGHVDVSAAMGAEVDANALTCLTADLSAAMGAEISAYSSETFEASASMGGDIQVAGQGRAEGRSAGFGGSISP